MKAQVRIGLVLLKFCKLPITICILPSIFCNLPKILRQIKSTVISIGIAMVIFCLVGIVFDISNGGSFRLENYQFTKMVVGCVLVGLGFGVPSIVYRNENIPMPMKVVIHMGIGCVVYTMVAFAVGWIGGTTIIQNVIIAVIQLVVAFLIWFAFMAHFRNEAKKMNDRIQSRKG